MSTKSKKDARSCVGRICEVLDELSDDELLKLGKIFALTDLAVKFFKSKHHPKFYKNRDELIRAIRRNQGHTFYDLHDRLARYFVYSMYPKSEKCRSVQKQCEEILAVLDVEE